MYLYFRASYRLFQLSFLGWSFESYENNTIKTCKVVFGSEPKDCEIYELVLKKYYQLKFSTPMQIDENYQRPKAVNPKRLQRQVHKSVTSTGIGTKAQQAMSRQRELNKIERKSKSKQQKENDTKRKFDLKQEKKKQKHRGH